MEDSQVAFEGIDGAECERFIQQIRRKARAANRFKDNDWIIELVATCMAGSALRWYIRLDPDVAEDWAKLQRAMIDKWPGKEDGGEAASSSIPTPAAAPEPTSALEIDIIGLMPSLSLNTTKSGYIRINSPGLGDLFVSARPTKIRGTTEFRTCDSRSQAMVVQFTPECVHLPLPFLIQNSQAGPTYLAISQDGKNALGRGSIEYAVLVTSDEQNSIGSNEAAIVRSMVWSVCPVDNSIRVLWSAEGSDYRLRALLGSPTRRLAFVSNETAFREKYTHSGVTFADARLIFEEI